MLATHPGDRSFESLLFLMNLYASLHVSFLFRIANTPFFKRCLESGLINQRLCEMFMNFTVVP